MQYKPSDYQCAESRKISMTKHHKQTVSDRQSVTETSNFDTEDDVLLESVSMTKRYKQIISDRQSVNETLRFRY